ncbi:MAG: hypothetical protein ABIR80_05430, partial [Opitutaceae bacterium]
MSPQDGGGLPGRTIASCRPLESAHLRRVQHTLSNTFVPPHDDFVLIAGQPFCEREYLEMNPDVRAAVRSGNFSSGREHFEM